MTSGGTVTNSTVQLSFKVSWGKKRIYPVNATAHELIKLTGRKTFFDEDLTVLRTLGFTIEWIAEMPESAIEPSNA